MSKVVMSMSVETPPREAAEIGQGQPHLQHAIEQHFAWVDAGPQPARSPWTAFPGWAHGLLRQGTKRLFGNADQRLPKRMRKTVLANARDA